MSDRSAKPPSRRTPPLRRDSAPGTPAARISQPGSPLERDAAEGLAPSISRNQKQAITLQALGLLNEQLQARIVLYKAEMQTSPELDAITARVVEQLRQLQAEVTAEAPPSKSLVELEAEQIRLLTALLKRVLNKTSSFATQIIKPVGRRVAKLFFASELHQKTKGDRDKIIHAPEQGVYYVLRRYSNRLRAELDGYEYASPEIHQLTLATLAKIERDLQIAFLSRHSPELGRVMTVFTTVIAEFVQDYLPRRLDALAEQTVRAARTAWRTNSVAHKVHDDAFPAFRNAWETRFMEHLVEFCSDELLARIRTADATVREETVRFFTDPHVFSETGQVLCDSIYDYLCLEGFLDLPPDWRVRLARD